MSPAASRSMLEVRDLTIDFEGEAGPVRAVDAVSFEIDAGKALALVGASGSGKSVTALAILGLLDRPPARIRAGAIRFEGRDLVSLEESELRALRGRRIAIVFQDPATALDPLQRIGRQIAEAVRAHHSVSKREAEARAVAMLARVRMPDPEAIARRYPHQLSGGMRQRAVIAASLVNGPSLLVADEPTTALDVTIQAGILALFAELRRELGMALLFITHDLAILSGLCEETAVMQGGRIVERGPTDRLLEAPAHPYTKTLVELAVRGPFRGRTAEGAPA